VVKASKTPDIPAGLGSTDRFFRLGDIGWWAADNIYFNGIFGQACIFEKAASADQIAFLATLFRGEKRSPP